nr:immunoglobulin heavy chain junction region [Mus musculus]
CARFGDYFDYW